MTRRSKVFIFMKRLTHFSRCRNGVAHIEFAILVPMLILLILGVIALCTFLRVTQKLENAISTTTNVAAQIGPNASYSDISGILNAFPVMMTPFKLMNASVILTDVQTGPGSTVVPQIVWQVSRHYSSTSGHVAVGVGGGDGVTPIPSKLGSPGNAGNPCPVAALDRVVSDMSFLRPNDELVVGEIFYQYNPIFNTIVGLDTSYTLYRSTLFLPRGPKLTSVTFTSGCIVQ